MNRDEFIGYISLKIPMLYPGTEVLLTPGKQRMYLICRENNCDEHELDCLLEPHGMFVMPHGSLPTHFSMDPENYYEVYQLQRFGNAYGKDYSPSKGQYYPDLHHPEKYEGLAWDSKQKGWV